MVPFLMIFRRFPTTFRRLPKIFQNCSEDLTNVSEHFPSISEHFPKISGKVVYYDLHVTLLREFKDFTIHCDYLLKEKKIK